MSQPQPQLQQAQGGLINPSEISYEPIPANAVGGRGSGVYKGLWRNESVVAVKRVGSAGVDVSFSFLPSPPHLIVPSHPYTIANRAVFCLLQTLLARLPRWQSLSLSHPHLLDIFGCTDPDAPENANKNLNGDVLLVTRLCENGNVREYLRENPNVERPHIVSDF
jgi:hypothetical protein